MVPMYSARMGIVILVRFRARQDLDRPLEMVEMIHPTLGGGLLLLDKAFF